MEKPAASSLPLTLAIYSCRDVCAAAAAAELVSFHSIHFVPSGTLPTRKRKRKTTTTTTAKKRWNKSNKNKREKKKQLCALHSGTRMTRKRIVPLWRHIRWFAGEWNLLLLLLSRRCQVINECIIVHAYVYTIKYMHKYVYICTREKI